MEKTITVRFEDDNTLKEEQKLSYIRYINRNLAVLKDDIISNKGYVRVVAKKEVAGGYITFVSNNSELNKKVNSKLYNSPPFQS